MSERLWLPYWIALRPAGRYSDTDLLDHFGLSTYRRADRNPRWDHYDYVVLANHGEWALIADGVAYALCNRASTRLAIEKLGTQCEVFTCYLADCIDEFGFEYYRQGVLVRRYFVTEGGPEGPVILADVGAALPGEVDVARQAYQLNTRLAVAAALGIKTEYSEEDVRFYVPDQDEVMQGKLKGR